MKCYGPFHGRKVRGVSIDLEIDKYGWKLFCHVIARVLTGVILFLVQLESHEIVRTVSVEAVHQQDSVTSNLGGGMRVRDGEKWNICKLRSLVFPRCFILGPPFFSVKSMPNCWGGVFLTSNKNMREKTPRQGWFASSSLTMDRHTQRQLLRIGTYREE